MAALTTQLVLSGKGSGCFCLFFATLLFFLGMTLGAGSRSVFVAGFFVGGFVATYTVEMDSLCVILQSFLI